MNPSALHSVPAITLGDGVVEEGNDEVAVGVVVDGLLVSVGFVSGLDVVDSVLVGFGGRYPGA